MSHVYPELTFAEIFSRIKRMFCAEMSEVFLEKSHLPSSDSDPSSTSISLAYVAGSGLKIHTTGYYILDFH
jgi:hypothetical protein